MTAGLEVAVGILLPAWFLFHHPTTSDEAVTGLIAEQILHGHTSAFFFGQPFGGVEPYVVAAFFGVLGAGTLALTLAPTCLSAAAALLVWRVARRLVDDPALAVLAGALAFAALAADYTTTIEGGYRGVTLLWGLWTLLFALRIHDGHREYPDLLALGLFAGVGWWSLPEIADLGLPASVLVVLAVRRTPRSRLATWAPRLATAAAAFGFGALPWIWANVRSGFASLDPARLPGTATPLDPGYLGRLRIFRGRAPAPARPAAGGKRWGAVRGDGHCDARAGPLRGARGGGGLGGGAGRRGVPPPGGAPARALGLGLVAYPFLVASSRAPGAGSTVATPSTPGPSWPWRWSSPPICWPQEAARARPGRPGPGRWPSSWSSWRWP